MLDEKLVDKLLDKSGSVAIVIRERLRPVGGGKSVIFPPTYAPDKKSGQEKSGYNIDPVKDGNRCVIDSVQSQANRIETVFLEEPYSKLVPQVIVKAGEKTVNLLEAAHRLADAAARFSALEDEIDEAFGAYLAKGDAEKIARLSPMSVVFGAWDSRGTQAKLPRILNSTIFADNVTALTRSSQFNPSFTVDHVDAGKSEEELAEKEKEKWSKAGLAHAPGKAAGGVLIHGEIFREAVVNLITLRHLKASDKQRSDALRKYILGLTLVSATLPQDYDLRSGCQLVQDGKDASSAKLVFRDGEESAFSLKHEDALTFAKVAAEKFGVETKRKETDFDPKKAQAYLDEKKDKKTGKPRSKKSA